MPLLSANAHRALAAASSLAVAGLLTLSAPSAHAASGDRDGDKMPNRWESAHGLNPYRADARGDADRDGLRNNDGDEVHDARASTDVTETCVADDDDRDGDTVSDEDENDHGTSATKADTDGVSDAHEDSDDDGVTDGVEDDQQDRADDAADGDDDSQGDDCQGDEA